MKGYVYLDLDLNLVRKDKDYIDNIDPRFFVTNAQFMIRKWVFDTEDTDNMMVMLKAFRDLGVETSRVMLFLKDISFDLNTLKNKSKDNANKIQ